MALGRAKPPKGLPIHSDSGSQCAQDDRALIAKNGPIQSMSRKGKPTRSVFPGEAQFFS
jgi:transposase InsO family protein